jgi:SAM-dependent methyltransferase
MKINNYDIIADLYDIFADETCDINFFVTETKKTSGEVLELMSGTGRVSIPLLEAGVKLTCVDISPKLNAIFTGKLKQKGLSAEIYQMDVCLLDIPKKFDVIIIPLYSFAHIVSPDDQRQALTRIYQHLLPGGTFICTLRNPALRAQNVDGQLRLIWKFPLDNGQGNLLFWIMEQMDPDDDHAVNGMEFFEQYDAEGVLKSKRLMELHFRLSRRDEFENLLKATGYTIKAFYGDYSYTEFNELNSPYMIWVLEKKGG